MPAIPSDCKQMSLPLSWPRLFWRCTLWLAANSLVLSGIAFVLRMVRRVMGQRRCEAILERIVKSPLFPVRRLACDKMEGDWYLAFNGLAEQYFKQRIRWRMDGVDINEGVASLPPSPPTAQSKVKVGVLAKFSGTLSFGINLFESVPDIIETYAFDIPYGGSNLSALCSHVHLYMGVEEDAEKAKRINECGLDILINLDPKISHELLSRLTTPCIVNYLTGNIPLPHPKISFTAHPVEIAGYRFAHGRLYSEASGRALSNDLVFPARFLYDGRGFLASDMAKWNERENLMFVHGSLYKLASPAYLDLVCTLLRDDPSLRFAFMGKARGNDLKVIFDKAAEWNVTQQIAYLGQFDSTRDENGRIADANWELCIDMLKRARLVPQPFPYGGGSSRFESYVFGVPSISMDVGEFAYCNVNCLKVDAAMATDPIHYLSLARMCLYDGAFSDSLQLLQKQAVESTSSSLKFWDSLLETYLLWLTDYRHEYLKEKTHYLKA